MYTAQRWTGAIAFFYIVWHTWHLRFTGIHLLSHPGAAFGKVQMEFQTSVGGGILCGGHFVRFVALRLRHVAVCRQVGHHDR